MWLMKIDEDPLEDFVSTCIKSGNNVLNVMITFYIMLVDYMT